VVCAVVAGRGIRWRWIEWGICQRSVPEVSNQQPAAQGWQSTREIAGSFPSSGTGRAQA
jgi:hypothetical protein